MSGMTKVVAPYFLMAMAGTYLSIAQAALDYTLHHLRTRMHEHSGEMLGQLPVSQHKVTEFWTMVEKTRLLIYHAAALGDIGDAQALVSILTSKSEVAETASTKR